MLFKEIKARCVVCGKHGAEHHHIKTRGSGGTDDPWNLLDLCRQHHSEVHAQGLKRFTERYQGAKKAIEAKGWQYCPVLLKWTNTNEQKE